MKPYLSAFNYLQQFNVADYAVDFMNTFSGIDDGLPDDSAEMASYISRQMNMLQHAEFGMSEEVEIGDYIRETHHYRFSPISPYKTYVVFNPRPSHGQGKLPDKITYQFVNAAQIRELTLSQSYLDLQRAYTYVKANIIFHMIGVVDNDMSKVLVRIDTMQLYEYSSKGEVLIKTIEFP